MSKYNEVTVVGSAANSIKAGFVGIERTLDLYVRGMDMLHKECDIIERRQDERLQDQLYILEEQALKNKARRTKLTS
jgi:hypothetical protein